MRRAISVAMRQLIASMHAAKGRSSAPPKDGAAHARGLPGWKSDVPTVPQSVSFASARSNDGRRICAAAAQGGA